MGRPTPGIVLVIVFPDNGLVTFSLVLVVIVGSTRSNVKSWTESLVGFSFLDQYCLFFVVGLALLFLLYAITSFVVVVSCLFISVVVVLLLLLLGLAAVDVSAAVGVVSEGCCSEMGGGNCSVRVDLRTQFDR